MRKLLYAFLCGAIVATGALAAGLENIEWSDIWISHANESMLPRVLLIGDSIARDYYPGVERHFAGVAYVGRIATSRFISDRMLLKEIEPVLDEMKFDVIQFNNGMHGWSHSEDEYRQAFPGFVEAIQTHAKGAKLIWASTTTLKVSQARPGNRTAPSDERIAARNAIALEYVKAHGIEVDDLAALVSGHPEYHDDDVVHFNQLGVQKQVEQVADCIGKFLPQTNGVAGQQ